MTNAEAIDILNTYKKREETIWGRETDYAKALKVAVNAIEARMDILEAVHNTYCFECVYRDYDSQSEPCRSCTIGLSAFEEKD